MLSNFMRNLKISSTGMPYYAVRVGRNPGVYQTWNACKAEVDQFPKARYKKFATELEAKAFVTGFDRPGQPAGSRYGQANPSKMLTGSVRTLSGTSHNNNTSQKIDTTIVDKEIEVLKEKLELLEKQKALAVKEQELEEMRNRSSSSSVSEPQCPSSPVGRVSRMSRKHASHSNRKPYSRGFTTSTNNQFRRTKMLEIQEVIDLTKESMGENNGGGVIVYTDGACINNGQHGSKAGIGVYWGPDHPSNISEKLEGRPTNNRAEIHAVVKAVEQAKEMGISDLNVHTDSKFLIDSMTKWVKNWQRNGWKLSTGGNVINRKDFETLLSASRGMNITYTHVRGHQGIAGNEAADRLAVQGAQKQ